LFSCFFIYPTSFLLLANLLFYSFFFGSFQTFKILNYLFSSYLFLGLFSIRLVEFGRKEKAKPDGFALRTSLQIKVILEQIQAKWNK